MVSGLDGSLTDEYMDGLIDRLVGLRRFYVDKIY